MQGTLLNISPLVAVFDDVFGQDVADAAIAAGRDNLKQASYVSSEGIKTGEKRTNSAARFDQWSTPLVAELVEKISSFVRLPPENCEPASLLHYEGEQLFDIHIDGYIEGPATAELLSQGGQRLFTTLCYLNDVDGGGQTAFPKLKLAVRPKLGRVLIFSNTIPGSNVPFQDAAHVGFGPENGEKWLLSLWWRERNYHVLRSFPETEGDYREF